MRPLTMLLGTTVMLLAFIQVEGMAQEKYVPKADEEIYGTWTNEKNTNISGDQKLVYEADGLWKAYFKIADPLPYEEGTFRIDSKWTDSEGNIWYKTFGAMTSGRAIGVKYQELIRISEAGAVWEGVYADVLEFDPDSYPAKVDPQDYTYAIYYRAEGKYVPKPDEEIYGTWVDDTSTQEAYKWVISAKGTILA